MYVCVCVRARARMQGYGMYMSVCVHVCGKWACVCMCSVSSYISGVAIWLKNEFKDYVPILHLPFHQSL